MKKRRQRSGQISHLIWQPINGNCLTNLSPKLSNYLHDIIEHEIGTWYITGRYIMVSLKYYEET